MTFKHSAHRRSPQVTIVRRVNRVTGEKRYTPMIRGKELRLSWKTKTYAEAYGAMILDRYVKKLALLASSAREN